MKSNKIIRLLNEAESAIDQVLHTIENDLGTGNFDLANYIVEKYMLSRKMDKICAIANEYRKFTIAEKGSENYQPIARYDHTSDHDKGNPRPSLTYITLRNAEAEKKYGKLSEALNN